MLENQDVTLHQMQEKKPLYGKLHLAYMEEEERWQINYRHFWLKTHD
jgi:hypothetical protein